MFIYSTTIYGRSINLDRNTAIECKKSGAAIKVNLKAPKPLFKIKDFTELNRVVSNRVFNPGRTNSPNMKQHPTFYSMYVE